jgi:RNA polymerase sigma-70 factor, ECF subfamily
MQTRGRCRPSIGHERATDVTMDPLAIGRQLRPTPADVALVERARHGDSIAFEALLSPRLDRLFRTAWAILGSEADARDATQDACLATWRQLPRLRNVERFDAWSSSILVNACLERLRQRARVREVPMTPAHDREAPAPTDPASFGEADAISRAFDRLNPDARAILVLHHLRREPVSSIAATLGIPSGTVKWRLHAARGALEKALAGERR